MSRRVVLACDANPRYAFALPITCRLWRMIGFDPLVVLVGTKARTWPMGPDGASYLKSGLDEWGVAPIEGFNSSTVAQCSRLAAWTLAAPGDYVLTADVDMWPLDAGYFRSEPAAGMLDLYSWAAYNHEKQFKLPICYLGARRELWAEICGDWRSIDEGMNSILGACGYGADDWDQWNWDEQWISRQIRNWAGFPRQCWNHPRGNGQSKEFWSGGPGSGVIGRIDRAAWPRLENELPSRAIDAHLPVEPWADVFWAASRAIVAKYAGDELADWADEYRAAWMRAMPVAEVR